jgi:excisionase family DNA binding protein
MLSDTQSACIGVSDLATRLGLSTRSIWRIIGRGELPTLRIGRRRLVRLSAVHNWLAGHEGEATTPGSNVTNAARRFAVR